MKHCINCEHLHKMALKEGLGICMKHGFLVKDSLSGCQEKPILKNKKEKKS